MYMYNKDFFWRYNTGWSGKKDQQQVNAINAVVHVTNRRP